MAKAEAVSLFMRLSHSLRFRRPVMRFAHTYEREACFLALLGTTLFYLTALASYSPFDASTLAASHPIKPAENLAGMVGANISGWAMFFFGIVSWVLPLPMLTSAFLIWRRSESVLAKTRLLGWAFALSALCALITIKKSIITIDGFDFPSGGWVGTSLSQWLNLWLGHIGGMIVLLTVMACSTLLILRKSLLTPLMSKGLTRWQQASEARGQAFVKELEKPDCAPSARWWEAFLKRSECSQPTASLETAESANRSDDPTTSLEPALSPYESVLPLQTSIAAAPNHQDPALFTSKATQYEPAIHAKSQPLQVPDYAPPPLSVFRKTDPANSNVLSAKEVDAIASLLVKTFEDFGVTGSVIGYQPGPVVTVYEFQPDAGTKQSKVLGLMDDVALALKVDSIFIHPVKGKSALGIQVPNAKREHVFFGDIVSTPAFREAESPLTFGMGKTISGHPMCADLASMPHLLAAGATGSGKSVAINALLCSIIMKAKPDDVRMILVDPKMLELSVYEGIPHLLMPVITEPAKASLALKWAAFEMERRYKLMQHACVRNIAGFNAFWDKASASKRDEFRQAVGDDALNKLPYILIVIDELADLMMTAPKDVEASIQRLAQKARASGIHMVLATQRPSVDIITGVIKANLPCRIAFQVVSKHDSRTILDLIGAEKLLGKGDLLLQRPGIGRLERIQGAFISDEEVVNLVAAVKETSQVHYDDSIIEWIDDEFSRQKDSRDEDASPIAMEDDPKWDEAVQIARSHGVVSASFLQRHLKIGYNRAARIVEFMESKGLVDKADGAKPRKWLGG